MNSLPPQDSDTDVACFSATRTVLQVCWYHGCGLLNTAGRVTGHRRLILYRQGQGEEPKQDTESDL
jgi:hypothetical protein